MPDFPSILAAPSLMAPATGSFNPEPAQPAAATPGPAAGSLLSAPRPALPGMRAFGDPTAIRTSIYNRALDAARKLPPLENQKHTLTIESPHFDGPETYSLADQKRALLEGGSLDRRLRGTLVLRDRVSGAELERKKTTLARVPVFSPRGTFIQNGVEYTLAHQFRLRSGAFTRRKQNGELETHINVLPGKGYAHRVHLDPATGVFQLGLGQANIPLLPVMRALGASDNDLREAWGPDLFWANQQKSDPASLKKVADRLRGSAPDASPEEVVRAALGKMEVDPDVNRRTLGQPIGKVGNELYLAITKKLLDVNRGAQKPDDRDHVAFMTIHGPEDLIGERIERGRQALGRPFWKSSLVGSLRSFPAEPLTDAVRAALFSSGLGAPTEQINPAMVLEQQGRVSRLGVGAIPSVDAVPEESRAVQPSYLGFVDPLVTPESLRAGVDSRIANNVMKGEDGRLYAHLRDTRTGQITRVSAQDLQDKSIAFPQELKKQRGRIVAIADGRIRRLARDKVHYELPEMEDAFSPVTNLIPFKSGVKGQRAVMAGRMLTQALPLLEPEAPFVQSGVPGGANESYEQRYGTHMGALRAEKPGVVTAVEPGQVTIRHDDGSEQVHELYQHMPSNRKTGMHQTAVVQPGQRVEAGGLLARSNYTDHEGTTALGKNLRVGYLPDQGYNFEDAISISESAAKKLMSQHYYQHDLEHEDGVKIGRDAHVSTFPGKFDMRVLKTLDPSGAVKVGTIVRPGDPLVLAVKERPPSPGQVYAGKRRSWSDQSVLWDHPHEGEVTDVVRTKKGINVVVKSHAGMEVADKLCYTPDHDVLTTDGWKPVANLTCDDSIASLARDGQIEYLKPVAVQCYRNTGPVYCVETPQVSLRVTDGHHLFACREPGGWTCVDAYDLIEARELAGTSYWLKRDGAWAGQTPATVRLVSSAGETGTTVNASTYAMLLGAYLSAGELVNQPETETYGFDVARMRPDRRVQFLLAMDAAGITCCEHDSHSKIRIHSREWMEHLAQFGSTPEDRFIDPQVFAWGGDTLWLLYSWLLWGAGIRGEGQPAYVTHSYRLAGDIQRLALHLGMSASIESPSNGGACPYLVCVPGLDPELAVNCQTDSGEPVVEDRWEGFEGVVHCVTLPRNHVLYVRRHGKPVWCGNSGRYGDKGTIGRIIPDHEMPVDSSGRPLEVLVNELGLVTRTNASQIVEAALGKIAERTGKPYRIADFQGQNLRQFAKDELAKHGLPDREDLIDPRTGARIPGVLTGNRFFMKLHHTAESKGQGRGLGAYTAEGLPAKGGEEGSKRVSLLDGNAILSSGATAVLRDAGAVRGQSQPELWLRYMSGHGLPEPKVPLVYEKFFDSLRAAGINPVRRGPRVHLMALTQKDVDELSGGREVTNGETVDWKDNMSPVPGGLFDPALTGGANGRRWAHIRLPEKYPNPVFEEPIRRVLGLTRNALDQVIAGEREFQGKTGPGAIATALDRINLDTEIERARRTIREGRGASRDAAVRSLGYLKAAKQVDVHPREWMTSKVPVLPPLFRPVSLMSGSNVPLVADPNYLYKELIEARDAHDALAGKVDDLANERRAIYGAMKAVTGLGEPIGAKNRERGVAGILKSVFGPGGPKTGYVQRKLLGTQADLVGRAVIAPDPNLDMDSIGLPEDRAWNVFQPFTVRRLVRAGVPRVRAVELVKSRAPEARKALLSEMNERPVIVNRAPVLHRYGVMAFRPQLVAGSAMTLSPLVTKGFNADFDGDAMQYHVPATPEAVKEALVKMLPSRNLLSVSAFKPHISPQNEFAGGLYKATTARAKDRTPRVFARVADALRAYQSGEIDVDHPVKVIEA